MDRYLTWKDLQRKIAALVAKAREQYDIPEDCTGKVACHLLSLKVGRASLPAGTDGLISNGYVVVSRSITWPSRMEFTIFHEITHHLLDDDGEIIEYFTQHLRNNDEEYKMAIERCCNLGAAEFLMPGARVRGIIDERGFSVDLVQYIADHCGTSIIAAAIQLASCAPIDCYVVLCAYGPVPRWSPSQTALFVEYASASTQTKYPLARFTPIPSDHVLFQAWRDQVAAVGRSYVPFRSGKRQPCDCEARLIGERVVGLLALERPVPSNQLSLMFGNEDE